MNTPIVEILATVEDGGLKNLLSPPRKTHRPANKKDKSKYYRFHKDHNHDTSTYYALKDQIEDLICQGCLKKDVCSWDQAEPTRSNKDDKKEWSQTPPQHTCDRPPVINTIAGGPSGG